MSNTSTREKAERTLRIVLFTSSYAPRVGGLETAVARLAREYQRLGHQVTIVTNRYPHHLPPYERIDGVPVHRILFPDIIVPRLAWRQTNLLKFVLLWPLAPASLLRLWLLLRALRPHVVNVHYLSTPSFYPAALSFLRLLHARVVVSCHGSDLTTVPYPTGSPAISRWILACAQAITTCSEDLARYAAAMVPRIPPAAIHVVYNGTDADEFRDIDAYEHPRPYVFSAGRLVEKKGMRFLIEAVELLHERGIDCDLIIAGSGPDEGNLRALVRELGLDRHVYFDGSAGRARLGALYHGCAVFSFAPVWEGFGIVSLEAMSCERAVVATHTGGIPEVVLDGETGLLARPADPTDLAEKLAALLTDPERAAEMGRRGRERVVERFTWPAVAARYLDSYRAPATKGVPPAGSPATRNPDAPPAASTLPPTRPPIETISQQTRTSATPAWRRMAAILTTRHGQARGGGAVPVLMYHQIAPPTMGGVGPSLLVTPDAFAAQMRLLHRLGWRTLRLAELIALLDTTLVDAQLSLPRRHFVLTFDDAFLGVAHHATPVLRRLGFTATVFVPTGLVGTCQALDGGADGEAKRLMSWDDLRAWRSAGFDVGAHTRRHPRLSQLDPDTMYEEVAGSRDDIAQALGEAPTLFAYPYGDWSPSVAATVRDSGYVAACTTRFGQATVTAHRFALPRISVGASLDLPHFAYRLARADHITAKIASADEHSAVYG